MQTGKRPIVSVKAYINDILNKVSLIYNYENDSIQFNEKDKWDKISMLNRIKYRMPSTTNSLESYHGHLNKATPRKNTFLGSIFRIACNLNKHNKNYGKRIRHNFNRAIQNTKQELNKTDPFRLNKEKTFYKTTKEHCQCSSNKLISSQLDFNIPCMHQLSILNSSEIPQLPDIHITLNDQWKNLTVDYNPVNDTGKPHDSKTADKSYLINSIKYYSKYHGKEIDSLVESK